MKHTTTTSRVSATATDPQLRGIDFSSRPSQRKPIVVALGRQHSTDTVQLTSLRRLPTTESFLDCLLEPGPWVAGCDFPFGLPRELVLQLGWPLRWRELIDHYATLERSAIRATFAAFCAARPVGGKFAHRACDGPAGASPSMKWVNPPVAYMLHSGVPALLAAGCDLPGLHPGDRQRQALEAYPGLLAREVLGRQSYKSDDPKRQDAARAAARRQLLEALEVGRTRLGLRLTAPPALREELLEDGSGDCLDATLCLLQVAWGLRQPRWGWPADVDVLEGWILSA